MTTRFYLRKTSQATGISPAYDSIWEDTASAARAVANTSPSGDAMSDLTVTDGANDDTDGDYLARQYVSEELTAGQTITGAQAIKAQVRASEPNAGNNLFIELVIRVIASDGTTLRKSVLAVTRDNVEIALTTLTNRQYTATSVAGNYTTQTGDRLVIEIGAGGNPTSGNNHTFTIRLGDAAGADLAEDDSSTTDNRPWVQLNDTLTFVTAGTYTGSAAVTIKGQTCSASATFAPGTKTASAAVANAPQTCAASATFAPGTKTASAAVSIRGMSCSASAEVDNPTYEGAAAVSAGAMTAAAIAQHEPEFEASAAVTTAPMTASASATHTTPTYTGTAGLTIGKQTCAATATYASGTKTGTVAATTAPMVADVEAAFTSPINLATAAVTIGKTVCAATATFAAGTKTGSAAVAIKGMTCAGVVDVTNPTYTGDLAKTLGAMTCTIAAGFSNYTAAVSLSTLGAMTCTATATFDTPDYTGTVTATMAPMIMEGVASVVQRGARNLKVFIRPTYKTNWFARPSYKTNPVVRPGR